MVVGQGQASNLRHGVQGHSTNLGRLCLYRRQDLRLSRQGIESVEIVVQGCRTHTNWWRKNNQIPGDRSVFSMLPVVLGVAIDVAVDVVVYVALEVTGGVSVGYRQRRESVIRDMC